MAMPSSSRDDCDLRKKLSSGEYILINSSGKSDVWIRFKIVAHKETGKNTGYVQCSDCLRFFCYSSMKSGTSHLQRHKCHDKSSSLKMTNYFKPQSSTFDKKDKDTVMNACVKMCCKDLRPFDVVSGKGFIDFAQALINIGAKHGNINVSNVLPHPTTISRHVSEAAINMRNEIIPVINKIIGEGFCAATTDMWTDDFKKNSFTSVTVHYFDDNWELVSKLLLTCNFPDERKTGENIRKELSRRFLQIGLDTDVMEKLTFVTDQGSNIVNALQPFRRLDCLAHVINTVLRNLFNVEILKKSNKKVLETLTGTKSLVTFLKQSGLINRLRKSVYQDSETRWNTKLQMLESVYEQYNEISNLLLEKNEDGRLDNIHTIFPELIKFLKTFREASISLENEKKITLPFVLLWYKKLLSKCEILAEDKDFILDLKSRCSELIRKKYIIKNEHKLATFLCPSFRQLRMLDENEREEILHIVKNEIKEVEIINAASSQAQGDIPSLSPKLKKRRLDSDFSEWEDYDHTCGELKSEIDIYCSLMAPACPEEMNIWWKQHEQELKTLSKIAKRILCIPASSASSERSFSAAGYLIHERRSRLKPEIIDAALFLHNNM